MRVNLLAIGSFAAGALGLQRPVQKFVDTYFWDKVLHVVEPLSDPVLSIAKDYGPSVAFFLLGLYLSTSAKDRSTAWHRVKSKVDPYYAVAAVAVLVLVGALAGKWLDYRRGPIAWVVSTGSPVDFTKPPGAAMAIAGFRVIGSNKTDSPVMFKDGYIRSDITGQLVRFKIGVPGGEIAPEEATLEPLGRINLYGPYPSPDAEKGGITIDRFREEFGRFTFHIEYSDDREYDRTFSNADVEELIRAADEHLSSLSSRTPGIVRRR